MPSRRSIPLYNVVVTVPGFKPHSLHRRGRSGTIGSREFGFTLPRQWCFAGTQAGESNNMLMKSTTVRVMVLLWASATNLAWGQEASGIGGRVVDVNGGVVPNAEVVVTSDETGVKQRPQPIARELIAQF
jgi:hypothetical protein